MNVRLYTLLKNNMLKLSQIEQKIRQLVPSLQELSFGCEVKFPQGETYIAMCETKNGGVSFFVKEDQDYFTIDISEIDGVYFEGSEQLEILGHPIKLHHIILAVINHKQRYLVKGYISGDRMNNFEAEILDLLARYDKTRDLSGQSEEVCDFIHQLICK